MTQIKCDATNRAPTGCLQYFTGTTGVGTITSFNYDNAQKLANQEQIICFR